jgi:hypothetical protein
VIAWEQRFWDDEVAPGLFRAPIDTTFAMTRPRVGYVLEPALRTGPPYVARHMPWYADSAAPDAELRWYREHADPLTTNWDAERAPAWKLKALLDRMRGDAALPDGSPVTRVGTTNAGGG